MSYARYRHAALGTLWRIVRGQVVRPAAPLMVSLLLTQRCDLRCRYCAIWKHPPTEMATATLLDLIDQIAAAGVERLGLSGGEAMLRPDIGQLIERAKQRGLTVNLLSNGHAIPERIDELKPLDFLAISLDGPAAVHDALRGTGSHRQALAAIVAARAAGIEVWTTTVLTRLNIDHAEAMLALGRQHGLRVSFQPVMAAALGARNAGELQPERADFVRLMNALHAETRRADTPLAMSRPLLRFYRDHWGVPAIASRQGAWHGGRLRCHAGRQFAAITPDGRLHACTHLADQDAGIDVGTQGFAAAWQSLQAPQCAGCWCDSFIESNLVFGLHPTAMLHVHRLLAQSTQPPT